MVHRLKHVDVRLLALTLLLIIVGAGLTWWQGQPRSEASVTPPVDVVSRRAEVGGLADQQIRFYQARLARYPRETGSWDILATAYMRKMRESGDPAYVLRAEQALDRALTLDPRDLNARRLLAWVWLAKHDFAAARRQAEALNAEDPRDYQVAGVLGDAYLELGRYPEAVQAIQRMIDLKPGLAAYSRVAHLRELHGDIRGAVAMMQLAVEAANPRDPEGLAWTRVQFGHLYASQGDFVGAEHQYTMALQAFPGYHHALAGLGNIRTAQTRFAEAIALYEQALAVIPLPEVAATLGDVYARLGRYEAAERNYALVEYIGTLTQLNRIVYNRELTYFYADHDRRLGQALILAEREASARHDIYTTDTLAWVYFKLGRLEDADRAMRRALALGTRDARLFFHTGMIAWKRGDHQRAERYLAEALRVNPQFHVVHADMARSVLTSLRQ